MPKGKCVYNPMWGKKYTWITEVKGDKYRAACAMCRKNFDIGCMGESAVKSHQRSDRHKKFSTGDSSSSKMDLFLQTDPVTTEKEIKSSINFTKVTSTAPISSESESCGNSQRLISSQFSTDTNVLTAEILWVVYCSSTHSSFNSNCGITSLFTRMFSDSQIATKFTCGESKSRYLTVFGVADYLKKKLLTSVHGPFVVLFDESLNKKIQEKQMDVHIRFWEESDSDLVQPKVVTRYLTSVFMGHGTAVDLVSHFKEALDQLSDINNMVQISMDGPNVNWSFFNKIQEQIQTDYGHSLIDIGSCGLHTAHNAFKAGVLGSGWDICGVLSSLYYLFKDSPARREDYLGCVKENGVDGATERMLPLKYVKHRWLENVPVSKRALLIWPHLQTYMQTFEKDKKKKPTCKSFDVVSTACKDQFFPAKLEFFTLVAQVLYPFLVNFQTEKPMVPFLASELYKIVKTLMKKFIKPEVIETNSTIEKLFQLDVAKTDNHMSHKKIEIGLGTEAKLKGLTRVSEKQLLEFRMDAKGFLIKVILKLSEKCPATYSLVRNLVALDPCEMVADRLFSRTQFKRIVKRFVSAKWLSTEEADVVLMEYDGFLDNIAMVGEEEFRSFKKFEDCDRLDEFFMKHLQTVDNKYLHLIKFLKLVLILSHGQAQVERGFSINKQVECENMKHHTIIAHRIISDYTFSIGGIENFEINKELLLSARSARQRYHAFLDQQRDNEKAGVQDRKRKALLNEISDIKKRREQAKKDEESLIESADKLSQKAETLGKLELLSQSNAQREKSKSKRKLYDKLSKDLDDKMASMKPLMKPN